jgi:predicted ribosome quality control (RQC) complex YloA/Tae2 family protein
MRIRLDVTKSVEENAADYYERAKKLKRKIEGMRKIIKEMKGKLKKEEEKEELKKRMIKPVKPEWFNKFRWFKHKRFLILGGRDATQNEILVKKHTQPEDIFFHADLHGAPAVVIKTEGKKVEKEVLERTADFSFSYSSAWKAGHGSGKVYWVKGDQISLTPPPGEYRPKGGIIVKGDRTYLTGKSGIEIGVEDNRVVVGYDLKEPKVKVVPGREKRTDTAKKIRKLLLKKLGPEYGGVVSIDALVRLLPGPSSISK